MPELALQSSHPVIEARFMLGRDITNFIAHEHYVGHAEATIRRREGTVIRWLRFIDSHGITDPGPDDVIAFLSGGRTAQTRSSYLGDLRRFYEWATFRNVVETDPTEGIERPRVPPREPTPLTAGQVARVRSACISSQDRIVIALGLRAGLRVSEMAKLELDDVRTDERMLVIRDSKGGKTRNVPMGSGLATVLLAGVCHADSAQGVAGRIRRVFRRAAVIARPHDLRHTFATEFARISNGDIQALAEILGHSNLATTRQYAKYHPRGHGVVDQMYGGAA